MVVMINDPGNDEYYGGRIAAPVFSRIMAGALRMLGVPPDNVAPQLHGASVASGPDEARKVHGGHDA
jgi:cell division protein FtsI (penicillin-binding protein 3)